MTLSEKGINAVFQEAWLPEPSNIYWVGRVLTLFEQQLPSAALAVERDCLLDDEGIILERTSLNGRLINCGLHNVQPSSASPTLQIKLLEPLSVGLRSLRFAQVWRAQSGEKTYVARILDPLYVEDDEGAGDDVFLWIDKVLVAEASAYARLEHFQGNLVPRFTGCFLTTVDTVDDDLHPNTSARTPDIPDRRNVYVSLSEYIPGENLVYHRPRPEWPICVPHKIAVIRAVCVAWHELARVHIFHNDFVERNIIIKTGSASMGPFCQDFLCKLRFDMPTTALTNFCPDEVFPIAILDFENYDILEYNDQPLVVDWQDAKRGLRNFTPSWFSR
ncbi:hypothetical protein B0H11DRAFT_2105858 [Mycena galericulata]|nr:hypothetical protein B0H11DRAFT_2105858 [Mycena galericulata]